MKWKAKNDTVGVPGKGYIKAENLTQEDLDNLKARAKNRKKDFHSFMLNAGFTPVEPQLEMELEVEETLTEVNPPSKEEKPKKRKRRTKAELNKGEGEE